MTPTPEALKLAERLENAAKVVRSGKEFQFGTHAYWYPPERCTEFNSAWACQDAYTKPEPRRVPYDFDSFPRGLVYLRRKGGVHSRIIVGIEKDGIFTYIGRLEWETLKSECELSLDNGATWQSADREVLEP